MQLSSPNGLRLGLVACVSRLDVLAGRLALSPCLQKGGLPWTAHFNCSSAAQAFNQELRDLRSEARDVARRQAGPT